MNAEPTSICVTYGFDDKRIRETILAFDIHPEYGDLAERIRREVIGDKVEELVNACFGVLARFREFSLIEPKLDVSVFKQIWADQLRRFGQGLGTPDYFAERLALSTTHAHSGLSMSVLHLQNQITQQILVERLIACFLNAPKTIWILMPCILKFTALDLHLTIKGYHLNDCEDQHKEIEELRVESAKLLQKVATDQLTGVMSYSHVMEALESHVNSAAKTGKTLCAMMIDLDFFKRVNDTHGHLVGDIVLRLTAERIKAAVRDFDMVGRFGGEEFTVILANADMALAMIIAERIRQDVAESPFHAKGHLIELTISIGVAMLRPGETREAILERADVALYEAKQEGRNRVVVAEDLEQAVSAQESNG
ncbi:Diguanylate cyclase (GGDEF) domain-containing protein [Candidatus Nitrotoga sp. BS]|uniref:GGDEF domain-containing protein n=1 Tax=Candidatus Nitrotoga sp. BS TaxID=2890408 RepID=UPI001EF2EB3B|nr:GGDEF domain-containing protein [Candidatus Nitrotoga sp. BS]CAH1198632.1 Diguanylate cyclase (GGDEF) domain-containing protein [Candidatus Nitrotoga sp. BS]